MEASLDLSRWRETPRGVAFRRWVIVSTGLRQLFGMRFFKILIALAWAGGVALAALGFLFSQSVADGGWLETAATSAGPRWIAMFKTLSALVVMYPDVCIGGWMTLIFWAHSYLGLALSLVALTVVVPRLITRDRRTNALTVYLSRPLTSGDYLLGKLGMIIGVLAVMWTGPLLFGWLLTVALAPNRDFIVYAFEPLGRALLFNGIALVTLSAIALGISAVSRTSRNTVLLWIGVWVIFGVMGMIPKTPVWLKRASFTRNLSEVRAAVIRADQALITAGESLPLMDQNFAQNLQRKGGDFATDDLYGALGSLGVFVLLGSGVFMRRLKAE